MATKRKLRQKKKARDKKKARQNMKRTQKRKTRSRPHLPDLVIHQIFRLLPTKSAFRLRLLSKRWEGVWSSFPAVLNFEEGDEPNARESLGKLQHIEFINFLEKHLKLCDKRIIDKFRLHMTRYDSLADDASRVDKWLSFAVDRSVREVDISLRSKNRKGGTHEHDDYFCLSKTLLNAESITCLNLEYLRMRYTGDLRLPSLKIMSLKSVKFDNVSLGSLISGCPSIEYLSLSSCSLNCVQNFVSSSSLKSLEIMGCSSDQESSALCGLCIEATNPESFTLVSNCQFSYVFLNNCRNLKYINIQAPYLEKFVLSGCQDSVEATINARNLLYLTVCGYLNSGISIEAPNLWEASIQLRHLEPTNWSWKHFSTLRDFLKRFGCSKNINISVYDAEALIFPENFRKTYTSPLPSVKKLKLFSKPPTMARDSDLRDSLLWMTPSAEILPICYLK